MSVFFINWFTQLKGPTWNLLLRTAIFTVYLVCGAFVFKVIESNQGVKEKHDFQRKKDVFQKMHNISETEFNAFVDEVRRAVDDGYFDVKFERWSYFGALFFTATVLTTIGFGHMAPRTFSGRLFCIVYAFIGIPLTGLMLKSIGEHLVSGIDRFVIYVDKKIRKDESAGEEEDAPDKSMLAVFTTIILVCIMLIMHLLLAGISMNYEGWTFFEGCYFGFITLSTIGFGDFVPTTPRQGFDGASHGHVALFIFLTAIYITLGLSVVSSVLVSLSRLFESKTTEWEFMPLWSGDESDFNHNAAEYDNFNEKDPFNNGEE